MFVCLSVHLRSIDVKKNVLGSLRLGKILTETGFFVVVGVLLIFYPHVFITGLKLM